MDTTLVVFGAGASVDCFAPGVEEIRARALHELDGDLAELAHAARRVARHVPPLTRDLVAALWGEAASCAQLLELLRIAQTKSESSGESFDFEQTLRTLFESVGGTMAADFLGLRHALSGRMGRADEIGETVDTLYTTFFARLRGSTRQERRFVFLSLNYDRLAEHALNSRSAFTSFEDYVSEDSWAYLQPHGSCEWSILPATEDLGSWPYAEPRAGDSEEYLVHGYAPHSAVPALALPMSGDDSGKTAWPASHQERLLSDLRSVDEAIVVGWRGADEHIVELVARNLSAPLRHIHLVGYDGSDVEEMSRNLADWVEEATEVGRVTGGFRAYVADESILSDMFPSIF